tara:strand:+ start:539 stop:1471 length:933 start_codon:yes stop_codon:yes gene_type:complete
VETEEIINMIKREAMPYAFLEPWTGCEPLEKNFKSLLESLPNQTLVRGDKGSVAAGWWNDSPWDTRNILYKTARIPFFLADGSIEDQSRLCVSVCQRMEEKMALKGYEYILYRVNASDLAGFRAVQDRGFQVVDALLTLAMEVGKELGKPSFVVRNALQEDMPAIREIARKSFIFDRFHTDPAIPNSIADELHANWIGDSFENNPDERVIVAEEKGLTMGFLSLSINKSLSAVLGKRVMTIILAATNFEERNRGAAKGLILASTEIARQEGFDIILVGTQHRNVRATRLYETLGFRAVDSSYTFRKLLKE